MLKAKNFKTLQNVPFFDRINYYYTKGSFTMSNETIETLIHQTKNLSESVDTNNSLASATNHSTQTIQDLNANIKS